MREIASEAGHTTGVVTHYFRDKRELMAFAFGLMVERSTGRVVEAAASSGPAEALAQLLPLDEERRREATVWLTLMALPWRTPNWRGSSGSATGGRGRRPFRRFGLL